MGPLGPFYRGTLWSLENANGSSEKANGSADIENFLSGFVRGIFISNAIERLVDRFSGEICYFLDGIVWDVKCGKQGHK